MRKLVSAVVVFALFGGVALSEEIRAIIIKIEGTKVTFAEAKGQGEKGPEHTVLLADACPTS